MKPWGNEFGICVEGINKTIKPNDHIGIEIYGNEIRNCTFGGICITNAGFSEIGKKIRVYSDTFSYNERTLYFSDAWNTDSWKAGFEFIKNKSLYPKGYHIEHKYNYQATDWDEIEINGNEYIPYVSTSRPLFKWKNKNCFSLEEWINITAKDGHAQDQDSISESIQHLNPNQNKMAK